MNMTRYGGPPQIFSMKQIQNMSRNDQLHGPYDIVYTGGEAMGCDHDCGLGMLPTLELQELAMKEKISDCAYLLPKKLLLPEQPRSNQRNYAVVNSMGGSSNDACRTAVVSADFKGYRDKGTLTPDSAVMTKELFYRDISDMAKVVSDELGSFFREAQVTSGRYIAVQHKQNGADTRALAQTLDLVSRHMNVPVIFFAAGTAPNHDNFTIYDEISSLMEERSFVYRSEHALKVVALISGAEAVNFRCRFLKLVRSVLTNFRSRGSFWTSTINFGRSDESLYAKGRIWSSSGTHVSAMFIRTESNYGCFAISTFRNNLQSDTISYVIIS